MIVTFLLIISLIRSRSWRRQTSAIVSHTPTNNNNQFDAITNNTISTRTSTSTETVTPVVNGTALLVSVVSTERRRSLRAHEVTFSGSVRGGYSDSEATYTSTKVVSDTIPVKEGGQKAARSGGRRPSSPDSISFNSLLYRSLSSGRTITNTSADEYESVVPETQRKLLRKKRLYPRYNTIDVHTMDTPGQEEGEPEVEDDCYDLETEEFYSNIQDATGTTSGNRSKRSSLFSRSDSSATTTSSSGTFTGKRRSAASIMSSSLCSDIIPLDRRRSSTTTDYSLRSTTAPQRRSSGRIRRYISRMTIAGARRSTTGRY